MVWLFDFLSSYTGRHLALQSRHRQSHQRWNQRLRHPRYSRRHHNCTFGAFLWEKMAGCVQVDTVVTGGSLSAFEPGSENMSRNIGVKLEFIKAEQQRTLCRHMPLQLPMGASGEISTQCLYRVRQTLMLTWSLTASHVLASCKQNILTNDWRESINHLLPSFEFTTWRAVEAWMLPG